MSKEIIPLKYLAEKADLFASASLSNATKRAYQTDWETFFNFCSGHELDPLPATPDTVALFLTESAESGRSIATIQRRITSINAIHEHTNNVSPVKDFRVVRVMRGIKRMLGTPQKRSKPISWSELQKMVSQCDQLMIGVRDAAILTLGWTTALRRSELVALNIGDLDFTEHGLIVTVRRSKTDQDGEGAHLGIPFAKNGLCPVKTVKRWLNRISEKPLPPENPVFPTIGRANRNKWHCETRSRLADRMISKIVKQYAKYAGMASEQYSAHSLRRGLATQAGALGVPERIISRHTRHRSIAVLRGYIEDGTIWEENPLPSIYSTSTPITSGD
jgi:integrase